jgi:hypothetical protein
MDNGAGQVSICKICVCIPFLVLALVNVLDAGYFSFVPTAGPVYFSSMRGAVGR